MRKHFLTGAALAAAMLAAAEPAKACMWDYDTIAEEHDRVPTAMETISGTFNRHSPAFYEWRIRDRRKKLEKDPNNFALLDDLGVALCKTGHAKEAVEVGEREVALDPNRYESQSNLGTFYIFAGDLEKSAEHIRLALKINPDAHFGREKYQLYLVEYLLEAKAKKGVVGWPVRGNFDGEDFSYFLERHAPRLDWEDRQKAITGVLGMMRFANHELPLLNEALGDLLNRQQRKIRARAYLQASYHAPDAAASKAYRLMADEALSKQMDGPLDGIEADFQDELAQGKAWMDRIEADEKQWIATSPDPDAAFDQKYRDEPRLRLPFQPFNWRRLTSFHSAAPIFGVIAIFIAIGCWAVSYTRRRKAGKTSKHQSFKLTR